jgi:transmembrane sensor
MEVLRKMKDLILSVLSGEATPHDARKLDRWRNESPENERFYQEFAHTWQALSLHASQGPVSAPPPLEQVVAAGDRRRRKAVPLRALSERPSGGWWWATAAAAVLALLIGLPVLRSMSPALSINTGSAETRTVPLEDGSVVRLGPNSRLAFWNGRHRRADFSGRAFFAVASDSSSPFLVETGVGTAEVLGTRFEASTRGDSLRLVVVEGKVALIASKHRVEATGGQMARILAGEPPSAPETVDVWSMLDWQDGLLLFQDTPLADVATELERFFGVSIEVRDAALRRRVVTAWFENEPLEDVVGTICHVVGAVCTLGDSVVMAS